MSTTTRPSSLRIGAMNLVQAAVLLAALGLMPRLASACPVCESETGKEVRAGIFNEDFGPNLLVTLLPFPLVLGIAAALHFGFTPKEGAGDAMPSISPTDAR